MIDFEPTVVLHGQLTTNPADKTSDLFKHLQAKIFSFRPETCVRQLFIFYNLSDIERDLLDEVVEKLTPKLKACDILTGFDAYEFLLRWTVGLLSIKYQQNDRFVLGKVRKYWTEFCQIEAERLKGHNLLKIIPAILGDAHLIRNKIETQLIDILKENRISTVEDLCKRYRHLREQSISPADVPYLWSAKTERPSREEIDKEIQRTSKKLISLQTQVASIGDIVKLNPDPSDRKQKAMLTKAKVSIFVAWEKKQLEQLLSSEPINESTTESICLI